MTDKPTDEEIIMLAVELGVSVRTGNGAVKLTRAGLAKWGQPAQAEEPVAYSIGNTLKWHEGKGLTNAQLFAAPQPVAREPLTDEQIQDLLLCGNPTDEEMRLIRIGWDAANGIKGDQHGTE